MAGFKIDDFKGIRPLRNSKKLPRGEGVTAQNLKLGSGDFVPLDELTTIQAVGAGRQSRSIFLYDNNGSPIWFEWDDYVSVARGPVKDDSLQRVYYTGDTLGNGNAKMTTNQLADQGGGGPYPESWLYVGVPAPVTAPTVTPTNLPEDKPTAERFAEDFRTDTFQLDLVDFTVYPGAGTRNQTWRLSSTAAGSIAFEVDLGTAFRVTEVVNVNRVKIESATEPGITMRTLNSDKSTVNDWHPMDEQGTAGPNQEADFIGWRVPPGMEIKIAGHNLNVGDVIVVSAINGPPQFWAASTTDFNEVDWPTPPNVVPDNATTANQNRDVLVSGENFSGYGQWSIYGSFYYDVDRASSDVSELEDRSYVYTYVNSFGEEGPPSPPSDPTPLLDTQSVLLSDLALPPTIGYDITLMRLYRTNSTEAGTEYQFVKEFNVSRTTRDDVPSDELGEIISTTTWDPPVDGMQGIIALPNGMLAGFKGKQVYLCEPYFPHAWPPEYDQATDYEIVGIANVGNTLVVLTKGWPYVATGSHPRNMNLRSIKENQACVSAQSIAASADAVFYASPDGIVRIDSSGVSVTTEDLIRPKTWRTTYKPETIVAEFHEGRYHAFYDFNVSGVDPVITAEVYGTITSTDEGDIVNGGAVLFLEVFNDEWVAAGTSFDAQRQPIIDGLSDVSGTPQTLGWNNQVRDIELSVTDVVRLTDTIVQITLPPATGYAITTAETIQPTIPAAALVVSNSAVNTGSTFTIQPQAFQATLTIGGTLTTEAEVVTGSETVTLLLSSDTWVTTLTDTMKQDIISGIVATTDELNGWNDTVQQLIPLTNVVRTSDTLVTVTLPAVPLYTVTANESLVATVPHEALVTQADVDVTSSNSLAISATGQASAVFSGTVTESVTENEIIAGGKTIIITLTNDTWIAAGTGPIGTAAQSDALVDAILATSSPSNGWNNVVVPGIEGSGAGVDLVRTSATVATITLDAAATYSISANETVGMTIANAVLTTSTEDLVVGNTFGIQFQSPVTCALGGTVDSEGITEVDARAGGKTITLTLSNDTWVAAGATFNAERQNIIDGLVSAGSETNGWDNEFIGTGGSGSIDVTDVVRTSDTVVTITLPADAQYDITANETITATVPASALVISAVAVVASPTFTVTFDVAASVTVSGTADNSGSRDIITGGKTIILTVSNDTWVSGATFTSERANIIAGLDAATSPTNGWNNEVRDGSLAVGDVVRTSDTIVTITLPATAAYDVNANEIISVTVPASALVENTVAVAASPAVDITAETTNTSRFYWVYEDNYDFPTSTTDDLTARAFYDVNYATENGEAVGVTNQVGNVIFTLEDDSVQVLFMYDGSADDGFAYSSADGGATWTLRQTLNASAYWSVAGSKVKSPDGETFFLAGLNGGSSVYYYSTNGTSWTDITSAVTASTTLASGIWAGNFYYGGDYIYLAVEDTTNGRSIIPSADLSGANTVETNWGTPIDMTSGTAVLGTGRGMLLSTTSTFGASKTLYYMNHGGSSFSSGGNLPTSTNKNAPSIFLCSGRYWLIGSGATWWYIDTNGQSATYEQTATNWTYKGALTGLTGTIVDAFYDTDHGFVIVTYNGTGASRTMKTWTSLTPNGTFTEVSEIGPVAEPNSITSTNQIDGTDLD